MTVTYFSTGVGEFIHYLMLKTWVDKTERMSVKFKDSLSKATAKDKFTEKKMKWQLLGKIYTSNGSVPSKENLQEDVFNHI